MVLVKGLAKLIRLGTVASAIVLTALSGYVAAGGHPDWYRLLLAAFSVGTLLGMADAINDIFDVEIDRVNKPWRPLPSGAVSKRAATYLVVILAILGVGSAYLLGNEIVLMSLIALATSLLYAVFLRKVPLVKNVTVAGLTAIAAIYGALSTINTDLPAVMYVIAFIVFWCIVARETIKDRADIAGDTVAGVQTFASRFGRNKATTLILLCLGFTVFGLVWSVQFFNLFYTSLTTLAIAGLFLIAIRMMRGKTSEDFELTSRLLKSSFLLWFFALLFGI